jgi:hypothetical protein
MRAYYFRLKNVNTQGKMGKKIDINQLQDLKYIKKKPFSLMVLKLILPQIKKKVAKFAKKY